MTIDEVSERYNIPTKALEEYSSLCSCTGEKSAAGFRDYNRTDIERLSLIVTLHDIGFSKTEVERYMRLLLSDDETSEERMAMLEKKRNATLDEIHLRQKQLDRLDYLRFEISHPKNI